MISIEKSVQEQPEYLFDHLIRFNVDLRGSSFYKPRYVRSYRSICQPNLYTINRQFLHTRLWRVLRGVESINLLSVWRVSKTLQSPSNMHCFQGMAIHNSNIYILSEESKFYHFKAADSISLIHSMNDKGSGIGEFMEPRQLDISNEGDLYVADFGNDRVQILDVNLQYKRHISHHSMLKPCDVKLTPDEVYVFGDFPEQSTYCIHIFTHMGEIIRSVVLNEIPNSVRCRGFCIDTYRNIIIIDSGNSHIKFFTKEGNVFGKLESFGGGSFNLLFGVAWMGEHKLVVISGDYYCDLEIYSYI